MKKGQICEGCVERVQFPNKGIVCTGEGEQAVVKNTIPGQKVSFRVTKVRKGRGEGQLMEVLTPAPKESTDYTCAYFGRCGGCTYLSLPMEEQLRIKEAQVRELLSEVMAPYTSFDEVFEGIKESPRQFGYRNKMEFSFGNEVKDGPLRLGLHKRGSFHDIVEVSGCRIADEDFSRILRCVATYFREKEIPFYQKMRREGYLRHLIVRKAAKTEEILIDLVTTGQIPPGEQNEPKSAPSWEQNKTESGAEREERLLLGMRDALLSLTLSGRIAGILHTRNDSPADAVINEGTTILYGQDYFDEEILGLTFKITPFSFFQTNSLGAEVLYETARDFIGDGEKKVVFDLYSGTGTIAQLLAPVAEKVVGVEIVDEAVRAARENARHNGIRNCEFLSGDVLKVLDTISDRPDFIVLDPPRDGIHPKALSHIIDYGVERMVYISCKPTSLARDLVTLQERGYRVTRICCVDMFPASANVETVVLLSKGVINSQKVKVDFSLEDMDITSFRGKATYEQIKEYVLQQTGMKVSSLYISQVKRKCGLEVGDSYNKPKTEEAKQPQCPPEKEAAIMDALKHFGLI